MEVFRTRNCMMIKFDVAGSATPTFDSRMATEGLSIASNMMFHFKNSTATAQ